MKNKLNLKVFEIKNNEQKKHKKSLIKYNTEYKNKNILSSFESKKMILPKAEEMNDEIIKNNSNKNINNNYNNLRIKKYLTNINDIPSNCLKIKINNNKNGTFIHRKSINSNLNNKINNNKNIIKQRYINEIIPNNNKILINPIKSSFIGLNNYNKYQKSPKQKIRSSKISSNSHSHKNQNCRKIINPNLNDKNLKFMRKNKTELNNNLNAINSRRNSSSKSNKNIYNLNIFKKMIDLSSSTNKQKNNCSLIKRNLNNSMNHRKSVMESKIKKEIIKKVNIFELDNELENNISEINYTIGNLNSNDFALCNSNSSLEDIYNKLVILCKEKGLKLAKIESNKFICKKEGDNSIKIEINKRGKTNVLKLYYLNGKEAITKQIIKEIILRIGF